MKPEKPKPKSNVKSVKIPNLLLPVLQIIIITLLFTFIPGQNAYSFRAITETYQVKTLLIPPSPAPYPIKVTQNDPSSLTGGGIMIVDIPSGVTLYEKNPDIKFLPASITKIMTALVALQNYQLDEVVTVDTVITEGQTMDLVGGEKITVENLLYGILVHSANDAAYALAQHDEGGIDGFITKMNQQAQELFLTNTHFTNPIGFDDPDHYTTPRDLSRLTREALKNPTLVKMVGVAQITVPDVIFSRFHVLKNINQLLGKIPGVSGFKTGWTENAGQSLITTVQRQDKKVLIVLLNSEDRFEETQILLDWVFANFTWQNFSFPQSDSTQSDVTAGT